MRHLRSVSVAMTAVGIGLMVAAALLDLGATWTLVGLLLTWAGVVKVIVVHLWRNLDGSPRTPDAGR